MSGHPARLSPTAAQLDLVRTVAERHGLRTPAIHEIDRAWAGLFLACFAFDPETEVDVHRRIRSLTQWAREGRDVPEMARKAEMRPEQAAFILAVLDRSGVDLSEVQETYGEDPEEILWFRQEAAQAEAAC